MGREIYNIINDMAEVLNASQMQRLQEVLVKRLSEKAASDCAQTTNVEFLDMFLTAKHLEGCSDKTIRYYRCNIEKMLDTINIPVIKITTEMLRKYLVEYQAINNCGKVTIDNIRRSLSTFFSWLEEEDYIIKSPMKRIHKVKTAIIVKDTRLTESGVELRLREMGKKLGVEKVHPHKFRRTMATRAIEKGMPIEQVQKILGHEQIDTTLRYAMVNQNNVKLSHRKFIS